MDHMYPKRFSHPRKVGHPIIPIQVCVCFIRIIAHCMWMVVTFIDLGHGGFSHISSLFSSSGSVDTRLLFLTLNEHMKPWPVCV